MRLLLPLLAGMSLLTSCDFSYTLVINNSTGQTQHIKYIRPRHNQYPIDDTVKTWADTTAKYPPEGALYTGIPIGKDITENSFSLSLDNGRSAMLEWGINSSINPDAKVIVNGTDTIDLRNDKRVELVKPRMGGYSAFISLK